MIEDWIAHLEAQLTSKNILVAIEELHLDARKRRRYTKITAGGTESQRRVSIVPDVERDPPSFKKTVKILKHIKWIDPRYCRALVMLCLGFTMAQTVEDMGWSENKTREFYACGMAVFISQLASP